MSSDDDLVVIPMIERNTNDPKTLTEGTVLSFHNISYQETEQSSFLLWKKTHVNERLSNISGIMKPGLNAIMGPEDGSRSLLLDVLAARRDPCGLSGDILINGRPRPANFKCTSGYVPQKDVVMRTVTVRENVEFSAALCLPMTISGDERRPWINEVLELLHLDNVANVKPRSKELRKRTSIAMELVVEHPVLFLDDPTTGLDLRATADIISVLRRMSKEGRTIIFSIDKPPYSIFRYFDSLTLVASKKVMFHGPLQDALEYFKSADYKYDSHDNPADFFLDIINGGFSAILDPVEDGHKVNKYEELSKKQHQVTEKLANMYAQSPLHNKIKTELDQLLGEQKVERSSALEVTCVTPFWHQLRWIIYCSFKNIIGFSLVTGIQAAITFILAIGVGIVFHVLKNDCLEVQTRSNSKCEGFLLYDIYRHVVGLFCQFPATVCRSGGECSGCGNIIHDHLLCVHADRGLKDSSQQQEEEIFQPGTGGRRRHTPWSRKKNLIPHGLEHRLVWRMAVHVDRHEGKDPEKKRKKRKESGLKDPSLCLSVKCHCIVA